ncbi:NAD-dependent epimerase/dehydratase family protein [Longimicrobium sp.]|uniref:NAD-dependent epimerase/dehydratase family protein n=1 Tax=Longimicrobium sp. TaxID=2029185 RepID=UPI002E366646|nr:NAD-dependent epimerase/dehydratase family protein [Longimicrobium sp.]HEX6042380.1 NAD-dependent epimerase/dehydratase family protein [Longimicrobium sp.]
MRVFVTGATGYVGTSVVQALRAAGHDVTGLARSDDAAAKLEAGGCAVLRGALTDAGGLAEGARGADAVIHAGATGGADQAEVDTAAVDTMLDALAGSGKPFVYTSGVWVLGATGDDVADEDAPLRPAALVAWRAEVERTVTDAAARGIRTVVLRPGVVYGRGGGTPGTWIAAGRKKGVVRYVGDGSQRWPFVHVDDLAELYVLALGAPAGTVLNAAGPSLAVHAAAQAAADATGARAEAWPLEDARARLGAYADALALDQRIGAERARALGWRPSRPSVLEELRGESDTSSASA